MQSRIIYSLFVCLAVLVYGCGKADTNSKALTGTVTLGGKPLEKGSISFIPKDGNAVTVGAKIVDGSYSATVPLGEKRIEIRAPKVTGQKLAYEGDPNSPKIDIVTELIPARYNNQSELSFSVDAKAAKADFTLEPQAE